MTTKWILGNVPESFPILKINSHLFTVHNMGIMILGNIFGKVELYMQDKLYLLQHSYETNRIIKS